MSETNAAGFVAACVQMNSGRDLAPNIATASELIRAAHAKGAQLVVTPENTTIIEPDKKAALAKAPYEAEHPGLAAFGERLMADFGLPAIPGEELAAIEAPTGLIWGRHDLATPLAVAEAASARYRWPLQVIDGAGDDPPIEKPAEFVQALRVALGGASTSAVDISTAARS